MAVMKVDVLDFSVVDVVNFELDEFWSRSWSWSEAVSWVDNTTVPAINDANLFLDLS